MTQGILCPNCTGNFQKEAYQIADDKLSCIMLQGGLSVNFKRLKKPVMISWIDLKTVSPQIYLKMKYAFNHVSTIFRSIFELLKKDHWKLAVTETIPNFWKLNVQIDYKNHLAVYCTTYCTVSRSAVFHIWAIFSVWRLVKELISKHIHKTFVKWRFLN